MNNKSKTKQLDAAEAFRLSSLVEIAPESIVSRVLARTDGGSLTLFAFAEGQELSEHTAPFDALVQLVEGSLDLVIGGETVHVSRGEIVLMPADVPHGLSAPEPAKMLLTMLK